MDNNMLKRYGYMVRLDDNRWSKRVMTLSPGGKWRRGRLEVMWEKEVESVMK